MYWRIVDDLINARFSGMPSRAGTTHREPQDYNPAESSLLTVRLLDDDEEHYYTAKCEDNEESLESLFYWAQRDAGTTIMQTRNRDGKWVDEIA